MEEKKTAGDWETNDWRSRGNQCPQEPTIGPGRAWDRDSGERDLHVDEDIKRNFQTYSEKAAAARKLFMNQN